MEVGAITVSTDAGYVVMTFTDHSDPQQPSHWRISPHEARQLAGALMVKAHEID